MLVLRLTPLQHSALLSVLIDYIRDPDGTKEWVEVTTDVVVRIEDLLHLVNLVQWEK